MGLVIDLQVLCHSAGNMLLKVATGYLAQAQEQYMGPCSPATNMSRVR